MRHKFNITSASAGDDNDAGSPGTPPAKGTPAKKRATPASGGRKRGAAAAANGNGGEPCTPSKKARKSIKSPTKVAADDETEVEAEGQEDEAVLFGESEVGLA